MKDFSQIVDLIKRKQNLATDAEVAKALEMSKTALYNHKLRGTIPYKNLLSYCERENILVDFLFFERQKKQELINDDYILIPQVSGKISAGEGLVPNNNIETKIAFQKDWLKKKGDPSRMSLIRVTGDSMTPTFCEGDLVLIDHSKNYINPQGGIYAISIDDSIMIKRLQVQHPTKKIRIISDNKKYDTIENVNPADIIINGKVIWYGRDLER